MEDLIFIVLYVSIPVIILTMGFIAVLTREEEAFKRNGHDRRTRPPE